MDNTELIIKYLREKLPATEVKEVIQRIQSDADFAKEVEDYKKILNGFEVKKARAFRNQLKEWANEEKPIATSSSSSDENIPGESPSTSFTSTAQPKRNLLRAGLMIGLLLITGYLFNIYNLNPSPKPKKEIVQNENTIKRSLLNFKENKRGEMVDGTEIVNTQEAITIFKNSVTAFDNKNYKESIAALKNINENEACYPNALYLLAHSYFQNENFVEASNTFKTIFDNDIYYEHVGRDETGRLYYFSLYENFQKNKSKENKQVALDAIDYFLKNSFEDAKGKEEARKYKAELLRYEN